MRDIFNTLIRYNMYCPFSLSDELASVTDNFMHFIAVGLWWIFYHDIFLGALFQANACYSILEQTDF